MNARQKAKKLKKELDYLKSEPLRNVYKVTTIKSEHLRAYRIFSINEIERMGDEFIENEARHQLSIDFIKFIREKMILNKDSYNTNFNTIRYSADLWINFGDKNNI